MIQTHIHHICIQTNTYAESKYFYTTVLGGIIHKETANFHTRAFNTWIAFTHFFIELQTGKNEQLLQSSKKDCEGITHFCFYVEDVSQAVKSILDSGYTHFQRKNNQIIYTVEGSLLAKLIAPEGTIIELRDCFEI
ncbi:MAG: VOC family protein [Culicoidibacterales bacterium]